MTKPTGTPAFAAPSSPEQEEPVSEKPAGQHPMDPARTRRATTKLSVGLDRDVAIGLDALVLEAKQSGLTEVSKAHLARQLLERILTDEQLREETQQALRRTSGR